MLFDSKNIYNALAEQYDAYRPHYPGEALLFLVTLGDLDGSGDVADIGTGTGRIARDISKYVRVVYAVDTAAAMLERLQASADEEGISNIRIIEAPGEATGLQSDSLDLITLAQSFHWMDKPAALQEASRILKPNKPLVLLWNQITNMQDKYYSEITSLIKEHNPDYKGGVDIISNDFADHFKDSHHFGPIDRYTFPFEIQYTHENYVGFLLSKSYVGMGIPSSHLPNFIEQAHTILRNEFPNNTVIEKYETVMLVSRKIN